jgi:soluble lytic murein transglycosylase-like protein
VAPVRLAWIALAASWSPAVTAQDAGRWRPLIEEASGRFGIPPAWIERVLVAESGGRTSLNGRPIVSRTGAMGLMQLMPGTWARIRARLGLGADPHDPRDNIVAGTFYLRQMYDRFGYPGLFAAYNAGPARYDAHLRQGRDLPAETLVYVATIARVRSVAARARVISHGPLFFSLSGSVPGRVVRADRAERDAQERGNGQRAISYLFGQLSCPDCK